MNDFHLLIAQWYRQNARNLPWRESSDPYFIWLSEIILQQTRVEQGKSYYLKFITNYPTVNHLAQASEQEILKDWQGLGYYSRARNLHQAAKFISNELNGVFPQTFEDIIKLKGVGKYTASAISSFAFNEKQAVVDGNVYRVLSRVFDISTPIDSSIGQKEFQQLADSLIPNKNPGEHNQAIMEIGALICKPANPNCMECCLNQICLARSLNTISERPIKEKKTKIRNRYFHYLVFDSQGKTIIEQRTEKDIWENLFQFPLIEIEEPHLEYGLTKTHESKVIKHILSHQHIYTVFHHFDGLPSKLSSNWKVIANEDLGDYPLPRLIDKYLNETS